DKIDAQIPRRAAQALDTLRELENRDLLLAADVQDLAVRRLAHDGRVNTVNRIADVGKASRLLTVAMNRNGLVVQHAIDEHGLRSRPPAQVLTRTVRAEEPEQGDREPVCVLI